jgi:hypothetical protein
LADKANDAKQIDCDRGEIVIEADKVFTGGFLDHDKFGRRIADALFDCRTLLLDANPYGATGGMSHCLVCSEVTFDDEFKAKDTAVFFPYVWIAEHDVYGSGVLYHKYLTGVSPSSADVDVLRSKESAERIDTNVKYLVIARTTQKIYAEAEFKNSAGGAFKGSRAGYVYLKDENHANSVFFVKESEITENVDPGIGTNICDYLVN